MAERQIVQIHGVKMFEYETHFSDDRFTMVVIGMFPAYGLDPLPNPAGLLLDLVKCIGEFPASFLIFGSHPDGQSSNEFGRVYFCPDVQSMSEARPDTVPLVIAPWPHEQISMVNRMLHPDASEAHEKMDQMTFTDEPIDKWQFECTVACSCGITPRDFARLKNGTDLGAEESINNDYWDLIPFLETVSKYVIRIEGDGNGAYITGHKRFLFQAEESLRRVAGEIRSKYIGYTLEWDDEYERLSISLPAALQ